jgi:hypothetical protein
MTKPTKLLDRLDEIGKSLSKTHKALALVGLGSVGIETARLDEYSDLDFFAIVREGYKAEFLQDLGWLNSINPVAWSFQNTSDGYKLLFEDGIFCEFAVFEPLELEHIPFAPGRIVWAEGGSGLDFARPKFEKVIQVTSSPDWLIGEALSNLYIGLERYKRGEKLSAYRFVQVLAVDRILELAKWFEKEQPSYPDPFAVERRFEERFPGVAKVLPQLMLGYEATQESARNILILLEQHFVINQRIRQSILELIQ